MTAGLVLQGWIRRLTVERIEATLSADTRLAAELLTRNPGTAARSSSMTKPTGWGSSRAYA